MWCWWKRQFMIRLRAVLEATCNRKCIRPNKKAWYTLSDLSLPSVTDTCNITHCWWQFEKLKNDWRSKYRQLEISMSQHTEQGLALKLCQVSHNMQYVACTNLNCYLTCLPLWHRSLCEIPESGLGSSQWTPPSPAALSFPMFPGKRQFLDQRRGNSHCQTVNHPHCSLPAPWTASCTQLKLKFASFITFLFIFHICRNLVRDFLSLAAMSPV